VVYECLLRSDFSAVWLVRLLMSIRSAKRLPRKRMQGDLRQRLQGTAFVTLAEAPGEELVIGKRQTLTLTAIGVTGRFWHPDGGRCMERTAKDFGGFSRPGYAKVVWNFKLREESPQSAVLSTETRIKCFGSAALWKFRLYEVWSALSRDLCARRFSGR
jgi:hypothetical protein